MCRIEQPCKSTLRHSPLKLGSYLKRSEHGQFLAMAVANGTQTDDEFSCMWMALDRIE
jgi:hypothetical protein